MADPILARSDSSNWMYECVNCGFEIDVESVRAMPTCPSCDGPRIWEFKSGSHSDDDHADRNP